MHERAALGHDCNRDALFHNKFKLWKFSAVFLFLVSRHQPVAARLKIAFTLKHHFLSAFPKVVSTLYIIVLFGICITTKAQNTSIYTVFFKDKDTAGFQPLSYLKADAVQRRVFHNFPVKDPGDIPVSTLYLLEIAASGAEILEVSRWLNAALIWASPMAIAHISQLQCVSKVEEYLPSKSSLCAAHLENSNSEDLLEAARKQTERMGISKFRAKNLDGKGIKIAVLDAGFTDVDRHFAFEHLRQNKQIIAGYNFKRKNGNPYQGHYHGTAVLSNIGGIWEQQPLGLATGSQFLLAVTESRLFEPYKEEFRWIAAAEWAEKEGAQIINSSLGYGSRLYFEEQMDGHSSVVARGATEAAKRGILVINSAGNEGDNENWKILITPADADSVLAVGGIHPENGYHVSFGSYGPTAAGNPKPNVSAFAINTVATPKNKIQSMSGTSFSAPLVSGFAACAWQSQPHLTNMELFEKIEKSADLYPYFDYAHGYGIPQAAYFTESQTAPVPTLSIIKDSDGYLIQLTENAFDSQPNNRHLGDKFLYCHIQNQAGFLNAYWVVEMRAGEGFRIDFSQLGDKPTEIRAHFNGFTTTNKLP
jgi:hypothetical protein